MDIERLYKYGSVNEFTDKSLVNSEIWLSGADAFNDPFACTPDMTFEHDRNAIMDMMVRVIRREYGLTKVAAETRATEYYLRGHHRKPEVWEKLKGALRQMYQSAAGLYCLTERRDSILMWSHYANHHKGYCLEFEGTGNPFFGIAQKVSYSADYPAIDLFKTDQINKFDLIFLTKYQDWSYEQEWRIVDSGGPGLRRYTPKLLKSVTFGLRMPGDDKKLMKNWLAQRPTPVKLYQAVLGQGRYEITFEDLE